jgi:hypothetical protein
MFVEQYQFKPRMGIANNSACLAASVADPASAMDPDEDILMDAVNDDDQPMALTKAERKRQKRRENRKRQVISERPQKPGHDCRCPLCPGVFNKRGLLSHL